MSTRTLLTLAVGLAIAAPVLAQSNECSGATLLIGGPNGPFTNAGATTSLPAWSCGNAANDVWFKFQAYANGSVTVDTCGASIDTVLQVFSGSCGALTSLGCNDDGCQTASSLTFPVAWLDTYYIRVAGYGGVTGSFPVRLQGPVQGSTYASNTITGRGCIAHPASFYEAFYNGAVDVNGSSLTMIPSGGGYFVTNSNATYLAPSAAAIVLPLGDDNDVTVPLSAPVAYPGGTTSSLVVCSNGFVSVATGNSIFSTTPSGILDNPVTAYYVTTDFDPSILFGGRVKFEQVGTKACVTWDGVWPFGDTTAARARTFQFQFDTSNGNVHYVFPSVSVPYGSLVIGYSPGGTSYDGGAIDLSAALTGSFSLPGTDGLPLTVTPTTRPIIGQGWSMDVTSYPANSTLGLDILGFTDPGLNDLTSIGLPGCGLRSSLEVISPWAPAGGLHTYTIGLPFNAALVGRNLYTTAAAFVPGINAFGAITGNGVQAWIGDF